MHKVHKIIERDWFPHTYSLIHLCSNWKDQCNRWPFLCCICILMCVRVCIWSRTRWLLFGSGRTWRMQHALCNIEVQQFWQIAEPCVLSLGLSFVRLSVRHKSCRCFGLTLWYLATLCMFWESRTTTAVEKKEARWGHTRSLDTIRGLFQPPGFAYGQDSQ